MSDVSGRYWITYNGEIYNFLDLRERLMQQGHRFATRSDTETILAAYQQYGESCVDHLRGMFAFAIWDAAERTLFLARDRIGKKPLYFHCTGQRLVFASEIKGILQYPGIERALDHSALADYLQLQYVPFPKPSSAPSASCPRFCPARHGRRQPPPDRGAPVLGPALRAGPCPQ